MGGLSGCSGGSTLRVNMSTLSHGSSMDGGGVYVHWGGTRGAARGGERQTHGNGRCEGHR